MVELLFQNVLTKQIMLVKTDVLDVKNKIQKGPKRSRGPNTELFALNSGGIQIPMGSTFQRDPNSEGIQIPKGSKFRRDLNSEGI